MYGFASFRPLAKLGGALGSLRVGVGGRLSRQAIVAKYHRSLADDIPAPPMQIEKGGVMWWIIRLSVWACLVTGAATIGVLLGMAL